MEDIILSSKFRNGQLRWLVTGAAGFIGSNLVEYLLSQGQTVVALDNFATGHKHNLDNAIADAKVSREKSGIPYNPDNYSFLNGDICDLDTCLKACEGVDFVLHQAALGSVPRSLADPIRTNDANISGFLNMLVAARDSGVNRFVYAASSSTYGDHTALPKVEENIGNPLSPYAVTKYVNELYAEVFGRCYGLNTIGLRYFNVFGKRQDPQGAYAAVIPKWIGSMINGDDVYINGDGETSRDFCYIANVIQMNVRAALTKNPEAINQIYNVAVGDRTSLNQVQVALKTGLEKRIPTLEINNPIYRDFRAGDVLHSQADIGKAQHLLGYEPIYNLIDGLEEALDWYISSMSTDK